MNKLLIAGLVILAVVIAGVPAQAQLPRQGDVRINTYTNYDQQFPDVAVAPAGTAVVVWESNLQDGGGRGIYGQRVDADGARLGSEFGVNVTTPGNQQAARVATDADGNFVVAWQDENLTAVVARRFDSSGAAQGGEIVVYTAADPAVAMDGNGAFVVVWNRNPSDGSLLNVYGQRFSAAGSTLGSEFLVNQETNDNQEVPAIAMWTNGFVVVWESNAQDGSGYGIYGRLYNASGTALTGEFRVNQETNYNQREVQVAMNASGDFVVAWYSSPDGGVNYQIHARRYDATGTPQGGEFRVDQGSGYERKNPDVAMDVAGNVAFSWHQFTGAEMTDSDIFVRRFNSTNGATCNEFRANQLTSSHQMFGRVGLDAAGNAMVVWQSRIVGVPSDQDDIYGRRFYYLTYVDLGGGWDWTGWFGFFNTGAAPWFYHNEHGWMYFVSYAPSSMFFYTADMGWLWSSEATYPNLYRFEDGRWLWYQKGSASPRWFYNFGSTSWESR